MTRIMLNQYRRWKISSYISFEIINIDIQKNREKWRERERERERKREVGETGGIGGRGREERERKLSSYSALIGLTVTAKYLL